MLKILYGLNATGNGHICRSREIVSRLKRLGHDVRVIVSGGNPRLDLQDFEPYVVYRGFTFVTARGRLQYLKTALQVNLAQFYRDLSSVDPSGLDLVITDFEPISARVAKRHGIPSLGIGHQYAFVYGVPMTWGNPLARYILRRYAPSDYPIGLHWHHFGFPVLPPIVPRTLKRRGPAESNKTLVYLPWEDPAQMSQEMRALTTHEFTIYHATIDRARDEANLHLRPPSRAGFLADLESSGGVITNAGFELPSEALHLGCRLLVKPLRGQMEQESNALALVRLGLGTATQKLDAGTIGEWLDGPPISPQPFPDVAGEIARWIDRGRWDDGAGLAKSLWGEAEKITGRGGRPESDSAPAALEPLPRGVRRPSGAGRAI